MQSRLVENFTFKEMNITSLKQLNPEIVEFSQMVQKLRDYLNKPINVNSWLRSTRHNKRVGGSSNSIHLDGRAVDIANTDYITVTNAWRAICRHHDKIGGINYYSTFIHIDNYEDKFGYNKFVIRDYR